MCTTRYHTRNRLRKVGDSNKSTTYHKIIPSFPNFLFPFPPYFLSRYHLSGITVSSGPCTSCTLITQDKYRQLRGGDIPKMTGHRWSAGESLCLHLLVSLCPLSALFLVQKSLSGGHQKKIAIFFCSFCLNGEDCAEESGERNCTCQW